MANQITDNRTLVSNADTATGWSNATSDDEIFIEGTASNSYQMSNALRESSFNVGTAQNWANNTFYIWINCGVVGRLLTKAAGGMRIRFAGPTATNYFEVYVAGSDEWPNSVAGGWTMFVVSIEEARAAAIANGWTNGTPPATTAIQRVGYAGQTAAMTRNVANTWVDAVWRLPPNTPGIIVEGRNGGTTAWNFSNIATQLGQGAGSFRLGAGGSWVINTPLQIGINDTTTHLFEDTNQLVLWDNQEYVSPSLYGMQALGNVGGSTIVNFGVKTGTGDDATGAQGVTLQAAANGARFFVDMNDPNLNAVGLYGCTFIHANDFSLDSPVVEAISTQYIDGSSALVTGSLQLRNAVIQANTLDGVAFMTTDDLSDIKYTSFQFSDGHAVELTTPITVTQTSLGNTYTGYGAIGTNDAAIYNNSGGAVTINVSGGTTPTYRNGTGASTTVVATVTITLTGLAPDTEVRVYLDDAGLNGAELAGVENSGTSFAFSVEAGETINIIINSLFFLPADIWGFIVPSANATIPVAQFPDRQYFNPPGP